MSSLGVQALLIPSADPHLSEYVASSFERRGFISGFTGSIVTTITLQTINFDVVTLGTGSAGTALVTPSFAGLWTDGRYYVQAEQELREGWSLMKESEESIEVQMCLFSIPFPALPNLEPRS